MDASVIISDIAFDSAAAKEAIEKSITEDRVMFTSVIYDECMRFTDKKKNKNGITKEQMDTELMDRFGDRIEINVPSDEELRKKYWIGKLEDYKVLFSAEVTGSELLITRDNHFFDPRLKRPEWIEMIEMYRYIGKEPPSVKRNRQ